MSHQLSAADLDLLRAFDTPTVCNVIELFQVRPQTAGYMDKRIRAAYPDLPPMVGYASTATFRSSAPRPNEGSYASIYDQVARFAELPQPTVIAFQDLDDPPVAATFGEVMATTYKKFGAAGLITSGAGRDYEQVERLDFPCFCDGWIASHGYPLILDVHVPVRIGGIVVQPGDLLHGDANGVTTIPIEIASEVAGACREYVDCEDAVLGYLKNDEVELRGFSAARHELEARVKALGEQLRSGRAGA